MLRVMGDTLYGCRIIRVCLPTPYTRYGRVWGMTCLLKSIITFCDYNNIPYVRKALRVTLLVWFFIVLNFNDQWFPRKGVC